MAAYRDSLPYRDSAPYRDAGTVPPGTLYPYPGYRVPLALSVPWEDYPGNAVPLAFGDGNPVEPPPPEPPRFTLKTAGLPWGLPPRRARTVRSGYAAAPRRAAATGLPWSAPPAVTAAARLPWAQVPRYAVATGLPWRMPDSQRASVGWAWRALPRVRASAELPWGLPPAMHRTAGVPWRSPPVKRLSVEAPWGLPSRLDASAGVPWRAPPRREVRAWLPWGVGDQVRWVVPSPGIVRPVVPPRPGYQPPPGNRVPLALRCPWPSPPGNQVPLALGPAQCYFAWPRPRRYIVLNSAAVVRLPERTPVPVASGSIRAARDAVFRGFDLVLADPAALALLLPGDTGPKSVEINLNGWVWTGIVEDWDETREHPGRAVRVSGRSRPALLDAPYAPARSYTEASERTSVQLIDQELTFTGFDADTPMGWEWTVPAGAWTYDSLTPVAAITRIAQAAGAVVLAHPFEDRLVVRPRYPVSPWAWASTAPDVQIQDDYLSRTGGRGSTGARGTQTVTLPLWPASATDKPGLVEPLQLAALVGPTTTKAVVDSVDIEFGMQAAGNGAQVLVIEQTVTVDPAPAEPLYTYVLVSGEQVGVADPVIRDGTAGDVRLPMIVDRLITQHSVAAERGRNALAGGTTVPAPSNPWQQLQAALPGSRLIKGNVTATNSDGSVSVATTDGSTIRARPLPGQTWANGAGVFVLDGRVVDSAPSLPGVTQVV